MVADGTLYDFTVIHPKVLDLDIHHMDFSQFGSLVYKRQQNNSKIKYMGFASCAKQPFKK